MDCLPGYNWYVCTSPDWEYKGCCDIDACRSGCGSEHRQPNARTTSFRPTITGTTASRRTITSTIRVLLESSSTESVTGDTSLTVSSTLSAYSTFSTFTSPARISESPTSTSANMISETPQEAGETTTPARGKTGAGAPEIAGFVTGGVSGCIIIFLIGRWIFLQQRKKKKSKATDDPSNASPQSSVPQSFNPIPWHAGGAGAAVTGGEHSGPPNPGQPSPAQQQPPTAPFELPARPELQTTLSTASAPPELRWGWGQNPAPRVSIYDPSTLSLTIQREAVAQVPRRSLAPMVGNPHLRRAARQRSDFEATRSLPVAARSNGNLNPPRFRSSAPAEPFTGRNGARSHQWAGQMSSNIRHLSWRDWEEQGIYMTRGPHIPEAPVVGEQQSGSSDVTRDREGGLISDQQIHGNHGGQGYGEEAQSEDQGGDSGGAALHPNGDDEHSDQPT